MSSTSHDEHWDLKGVLSAATSVAREFGHTQVHSGHMLLALASIPAREVRRLWADVGIDPSLAAAHLRSSLRRGAKPMSSALNSAAMSSRLSRIIHDAAQIATAGGLEGPGPKHLLLATLRDPRSIAGDAIRAISGDTELLMARLSAP